MKKFTKIIFCNAAQEGQLTAGKFKRAKPEI